MSGNERADSAAKSALDLSPEILSIPYTDLKLTISKFLRTKWQQQWDINIHNKLYQIQSILREWRPAFRKSRREQVLKSRLRIGHTRLTHFFILKQEPKPVFGTVKHSLIECRAFTVIRKRFFKVTSLTELFENVKIDDVLTFLRETGLYEKKKKYDELKLVNHVQTNEIPSIETFTYSVFVQKSLVDWIYI